MAALVIVALFWGNCLSCPQVLIALKAHQAAHDCCKRNQKPAAKSCDAQGLQHFLKSEPGTQVSPAPVAHAAVGLVLFSQASPAPTAGLVVPAPKPPDRLALNSSLRI
jgi:hypothetical protein